MTLGSFLSLLLTSLISKSPTTSINDDSGSASFKAVAGVDISVPHLKRLCTEIQPQRCLR